MELSGSYSRYGVLQLHIVESSGSWWRETGSLMKDSSDSILRRYQKTLSHPTKTEHARGGNSWWQQKMKYYFQFDTAPRVSPTNTDDELDAPFWCPKLRSGIYRMNFLFRRRKFLRIPLCSFVRALSAWVIETKLWRMERNDSEYSENRRRKAFSYVSSVVVCRPLFDFFTRQRRNL